MENVKYVAVKLKSFNYYIWFKVDETHYEDNTFVGLNGWGKNGAYTNLRCNKDEIVSYIYSKELQYD